MSNDPDYDADAAYDRMCEDSAYELLDGVDELVKNLNDTYFYSHRPKTKLAEDLIQIICSKLHVKIKVEDLSPKYQRIDAIEVENEN